MTRKIVDPSGSPGEGKFAFDLLELDGVDYRPLPLGDRKKRLGRLIDRRLAGIAMNDHTDARGELVFERACRIGLEDITTPVLRDSEGGRAMNKLEPIDVTFFDMHTLEALIVTSDDRSVTIKFGRAYGDWIAIVPRHLVRKDHDRWSVNLS